MMAKKKRVNLSKEQVQQIRTSTLHSLENTYPGITAFQHNKIFALRVAFILRIALNILSTMVGVVISGQPLVVASLFTSLFVAWIFYTAMVHSSWPGCLLLLLWSALAIVDSLPVLIQFYQYYLWAVALFAFEFLCGIAFLVLGGWLCFSKKNRTYATAYSNAVKQATVIEQQKILSQNNWQN